jgi:hypothetical protein
MPSVGFEPTIPASERAKTVHTLDRAATLIANFSKYPYCYEHTDLLLNIIYRHNFYLKLRFEDYNLSPSSGKNPLQLDPNSQS